MDSAFSYKTYNIRKSKMASLEAFTSDIQYPDNITVVNTDVKLAGNNTIFLVTIPPTSHFTYWVYGSDDTTINMEVNCKENAAKNDEKPGLYTRFSDLVPEKSNVEFSFKGNRDATFFILVKIHDGAQKEYKKFYPESKQIKSPLFSGPSCWTSGAVLCPFSDEPIMPVGCPCPCKKSEEIKFTLDREESGPFYCTICASSTCEHVSILKTKPKHDFVMLNDNCKSVKPSPQYCWKYVPGEKEILLDGDNKKNSKFSTAKKFFESRAVEK